MAESATYDEWRVAAVEHDERSGARRWREIDQTTRYDYAQIRLRLDRLRSLRARNDYHGLLFTLNEGIHGNMGGMGRRSLYQRARFGTKKLIEQYIDEIDDSLRFLAELDSEVIDLQEKLEFFYRANVCFGRSALMLSGGGVLGFYHMGVVKALLEQGLLPRVISGSSAGALAAAVVGTHTEEQLTHFYDPANVRLEAKKEASIFSRMLLGAHPQIDVGDLERIVARMVPDLTFQEAYDLTGRQISITVAPAEPHQRSRLLNAIASPNVYVRSAVMASCAVPGVFPPVMLMAKNAHGEAQPYLPARKWVDGSIADDLPQKRLSRLYSTNHYIVSMVNPVATPFLHKEGERGAVARALGALGVGMGRELLNFYRGLMQKQGDNWPRFNMLLHSIHAMLDQEYTGDINIMPSFRWYNPAKILSHLSEQDMLELLHGGQHSTYPNIEAIRLCTRISRTMEELLQRFESGDLRPESGTVTRPRTSRRRPPPTRADREALRKKKAAAPGKAAKAEGKKAARSRKVSPGRKGAARSKASKKLQNAAQPKQREKNALTLVVS